MKTTSVALVRDLARPAAFPPPRPRTVSVATTHASWVFLTETEAWKIKRPVDFGFLDYSTLDKRRVCCENEVRLGRRLAPDVYLGVAPVYRDATHFSLTGPGAVVEYAVRMRRLADADSARALLRGGRLLPDHLAKLAEILVAFYASAPGVPDLGGPDDFRASIEENLAQTRPYAGRFVDAEMLRSLARWQLETLATNERRLIERQSAGKIREGHGDLRLEHVYFPGGAPDQPIVIDPIEFNRRLRCEDAALDAAFLAMELEAQNRHDLAAFFLSRFARDSNDYGFYPLLDLYLSYRAWVRAKVACFVAGDPSTPADKAARKAAEAAKLFELTGEHAGAKRFCRHVIAVGGMIGTGKSTLADALTMRLGVPSVSSDATRKALGGLRPTERGGPEIYTDELDRLTYDAMMRSAGDVVESGRGVILDATFREARTRALAQGLAREHGRPFVFVEVNCNEETIRARLRRRRAGESVSDAGEELFEAIKRRCEPPNELPAEERIALDGGAAIEDSLKLIGARL